MSGGPHPTAWQRFSFNQATAKRWPLPELVAGCRQAGVTQVGLWRDQIAGYGSTADAARLVHDAGLSVSSLCRGGFFQEPDWLDDNRRAIDAAAILGTPVLVLVSGGMPDGSRDLDAARRQVAAAIAELAPYARDAGVKLAIEPLHPMFASDRCVVSTLAQALELAAPHPSETVGVCVDTYHLWWDDQVWTLLERAGAQGRIAAFQLADWVTPLPAGVLLGRGLPGAGCIDMPRFIAAVDAAGYCGPIEVEVFDEQLWSRPGREILAATIDAYRSAVKEPA